MASEFCSERRVEFAETDMAGILHFANYFRYMEEVEHDFFRSLDLRIHYETDEGFRGWARGEASCRYERPLRYNDVVARHLRVVEKRSKSIRYEITFVLGDETVARGQVTAIHVGKDGDGRMRALPIPADVEAAVDEAR